MSDSQNKPKRPGPPPLAMAKQAPGVRGARQVPVQGVTLNTGDVIGGKFIVGRYLGSSDGAVSYLCKDRKRDRDCVIKVIDLATMPRELQEQLAKEVRTAGKLHHRNLTGIYGMGQVNQTQLFVALEYVAGSSLARIVAQRREASKHPTLRDVFTVIAHLCTALEAVHKAGLVHGVLTPYNVMVSKQGVLKLGNLAFARTSAESLFHRQLGPFVDSIYVAPELTRDPTSISPSSDTYSLAMLCLELLSKEGLPNDRVEAKGAVSDILSGFPPQLTQVLLRSLDSDPTQRPAALHEIRDMIESVARERNLRLGFPPEAHELPIEPAVEPESAQDDAGAEDDLFDIPELSRPQGGGFGGIVFDEEEEDGRYLVQKGGLDYGPYTPEQILEQLHADEIDENTQVLDRHTQERMRLEEVEEFSEEVKKYIPIREERLRLAAERRAQIQQNVKKGGLTIFVVGIVAGLVVLAGMIYVVLTQPDPEPLPMDRAFASLDYKLLPPPKDFTTVAVDKGVMQSIFNPAASEEEIAKQIKKLRRKRRGSKKGPKGAGADENITEVDMSSSGSKKVLTDAEVNEVILGKWPTLRRCVMKEFRSNPNFKGVTVQFFIRPSGTTGGVKIKEKKYADKAVGSCLVSRFRAIKFPAHGGFNKGVVFPLIVQ